MGQDLECDEPLSSWMVIKVSPLCSPLDNDEKTRSRTKSCEKASSDFLMNGFCESSSVLGPPSFGWLGTKPTAQLLVLRRSRRATLPHLMSTTSRARLWRAQHCSIQAMLTAVIRGTAAHSAGDALRYLDTRLLVVGMDLFLNVPHCTNK